MKESRSVIKDNVGNLNAYLY